MDNLTQNLKLKTQNDNLKLKTDLKHRSYQFALMVIKTIDKLPGEMSCRIIGKQLVRSATSIGANIIEAKAASSRKDFTNFFTYALKSANESMFWLGLLNDSGKTKRIELEGLMQELREISNMLGSSILTLKGKNIY